nr:MAG TPA: hypothetical protein [Bacteriophage sp.]
MTAFIKSFSELIVTSSPVASLVGIPFNTLLMSSIPLICGNSLL